MKDFAFVTGLVALLAAGAWAADLDALEATAGPNIGAPPGYDDTKELMWDMGRWRWALVWRTGAGAWVGNDFDVSTIKTYGGVKTYRTYSWASWPNGRWDGFRIAIYSFGGGVPGSIMWPTSGSPKFVIATGDLGWHDFDVSWVLPGTKRFVAAQEQFYNSPDPGADPFMVDDNPTFVRHSWMYYGGKWELFPEIKNPPVAPYRNVMVRVLVDNAQNPAVAPTSIGRVKALYY